MEATKELMISCQLRHRYIALQGKESMLDCLTGDAWL